LLVKPPIWNAHWSCLYPRILFFLAPHARNGNPPLVGDISPKKGASHWIRSDTGTGHLDARPTH
jgi:hypothetical protein